MLAFERTLISYRIVSYDDALSFLQYVESYAACGDAFPMEWQQGVYLFTETDRA